MEVSTDSVDGKFEIESNLFVAALFLMIEDEDGAFDDAELLQLVFNGLLKLPLSELLLGIRRLVGETFFQTGFVAFIRSGDGDKRAFNASSPLPFILGDVDGDPIQIRREHRLAAKGRERSVEAEEDLLRKVFDVFAAAGKAGERAEDHRLMILHNLLEGGPCLQVG